MVTGRNAARTRGELLAATVAALLSHGPNVSIDTVAKLAQVSKGGLLHHFPTKADLLIGMFEEYSRRYEESVAMLLSAEDGSPGSACRAHIHATFNESESENYQWWRAACIAALSGVPEVVARAEASYQSWQYEFEDDGLHPDRAHLIAQVLNGVGLNAVFSPEAAPEIRTKDLLLALTRQSGPLA